MEHDKNYTYLLECSDGSLYCGWTNNPEKRLAAHNAGIASKYTRSRRPVRMVYYEVYATKQEARCGGSISSSASRAKRSCS